MTRVDEERGGCGDDLHACDEERRGEVGVGAGASLKEVAAVLVCPYGVILQCHVYEPLTGLIGTYYSF